MCFGYTLLESGTSALLLFVCVVLAAWLVWTRSLASTHAAAIVDSMLYQW